MNKNSAVFWLPKLGDNFPIPRTEVVNFDLEDAYNIFDGKAPSHFPLGELKAACGRIGYPAFLRTDMSSAKHSGPQAYRVDGPDDVQRCAYLTLEDNALKDLDPSTYLIRQFIELEASFAAFDGHPIAREWRVFASPDKVLCRHFYWPADAMQFYGHVEPDGWRDDLAKLADTAGYDPVLDILAVNAARACGHETWSVDFARDIHGVYWLIDMALARESWHPDHGAEG